MSKVQKYFAILFVVATLLLAQESTLRIGDFGQVDSLDPVTSSTGLSQHLAQFIFSSLIIQRNPEEFQFSLAKEVDISPDGLSYTFLLRENLSWPDGRPITSKDIEATITVLVHPQTDGHNPYLAGLIEDVTCVNPRVITITLSKPLFRPFALFTFKIFPKHRLTNFFLKKEHSFAQKPMGSGPYTIAQQQNNEIILKPNPNYFGSKPKIAQVIFRAYEKQEEAFRDLVANKVHFLIRVPPRYLQAAMKEKSIVVFPYPTRKVHYIAFNHRPSHRYARLFQDYRFRRALLYGVDRRKILQKTFQLSNEMSEKAIISGPYLKDSWAYNPKVQPYPYDFSYGKTLLREILKRQGFQLIDGYWQNSEGKKLEIKLLVVSGEKEAVAACKEITDFWEKLGLTTQVVVKERHDFYKTVYLKHEFDLVYTSWNHNRSLHIFPLFDPSRIGENKSNFSGIVDPSLTELFAQLDNTLNPWMLQTICHRIHHKIHQDTTHLFLWQASPFAARSKKIRGYQLYSEALFLFSEFYQLVSKKN